MLSKASALAVAKTFGRVYEACHFLFSRSRVAHHALHDFLFERDYPKWVCDRARHLFNPRDVEEWIMGLQTGESVLSSPAIEVGSQEELQRVGQDLLRRLAEDILNLYNHPALKSEPGLTRFLVPILKELLDRVTLDGYIWDNGKLRAPESDVLDTKEAAGALEALYTNLRLANREVVLHCLKLSEDHWLKRKWDDCISQARRALECVLQEVGCALSIKATGAALSESVYKWPAKVRDYLKQNGLLGNEEMEALAKLYGLLSATGSHPYIAQQDQARLLRQLALVWSQFVLLRYEGYLKSNP